MCIDLGKIMSCKKYTKTALKHIWPVFFQGYHTFSLCTGPTDPKNHSGPLPLN